MALFDVTALYGECVHDAVLDYETGAPTSNEKKALDWFASFFKGLTDEDGEPLYALPA